MRSKLLLATSFVLLLGCNGEENVAPDAAVTCSLGTTMAEIEEKLFRSTRCKACHSRSPGLFPTTLDLESPGLAARVVDQPAEVNPAKGRCAGQTLLPRNAPATSLFVEKVANPKPSCGDRMPQSMTAPTADEIACVKLWAELAVK